MSDPNLDQLCMNTMRFLAESEECLSNLLPPAIQPQVSIEATSTQGSERYIGTNGMAIDMSECGALAHIDVTYERFDLTPQHVVNEAIRLVGERQT